MKNETKHTSTPWEIYNTPEYHLPKSSTIEIGSKTNSAWICKVQNNGLIEKDEGLANAQFIIRAVNNHDKLVAKLTELYEAIDSCVELTPELLQSTKELLTNLNK